MIINVRVFCIILICVNSLLVAGRVLSSSDTQQGGDYDERYYFDYPNSGGVGQEEPEAAKDAEMRLLESLAPAEENMANYYREESPKEPERISPEDWNYILEQLINAVEQEKPAEKQPEATETEQVEEEQPQEEDEKVVTKPVEQKKGQHEFISFINPDVEHKKKNAFPAVQVKRSQQMRVDTELRSLTDHHPAFMIIVGVGTVCAAVALMGAAVVGVKVSRNRKAAEEAQYPQYGVIGPSKDKRSAKKMKAHGDASMAYGAQLHHYQQTKQQIIDMDQPKCEKAAVSDESDGEGEEEADYSVYECPGLAPTGNIEISNPLFDTKNGRQANNSTSSDVDNK